MSDIDPVDRALQSLGGRQWSPDAGRTALEHRLMESFATQQQQSFFARHRVLIPTVAILAMAVASFAAMGGIGLIQSWFATVTVNGKVVHTGEIVPDENGQATITLPEGSLPTGEKQVSVTLDGNNAGGSGAVTVTVTGEAGGINVQTQNQSSAGAEKKK